MSATIAVSAPPATKRPRRPRTTGGVKLVHGPSAEAKRLAAAILEVLAGARTPTQAAQALGLSLPRYYQIETRALTGLLAACEARPKGRQPNPTNELTGLRQENQRLQQEVTRQQSLARAAQRVVGLSPPSPAPAARGKKTRKRRMARALSVAQRLQTNQPPVEAPPASSTPAKV